MQGIAHEIVFIVKVQWGEFAGQAPPFRNLIFNQIWIHLNSQILKGKFTYLLYYDWMISLW